jgi:NADH dehydrogenase
MPTDPRTHVVPHVVIVGGGFGGLACAQGLRGAPVRVTLLDRRNHHLFQPLLYQVATAGLAPSQIAAPIRAVLASQSNCEVMLAEVVAIDTARRTLRWRPGEGGGRSNLRAAPSEDASPGATPDADDTHQLSFDYLVLASGATHSYFGNDAWAPHAPGLKSIEDALEIRRRFLLAFEAAEREEDPQRQRALLTFVIVGAGPTGVELAGAMKEIALTTIRRDFRRIDTRSARVVLIEAQDRVLPGGFPVELCARAQRDLGAMGVDVRTRTRVTAIDAEGVALQPMGTSEEVAGGSERIASRNVLWAAGVKASPLGAMLGVATDRAGRVVVEPDLSIPGHRNVYVVGDLASVTLPSGAHVPGMCPGAQQMGRHVARAIRAALSQSHAPAPRAPFRYRDKGLLATIGRARAVAFLFNRKFAGAPAWLLWAGVHVAFLISFRSKLLVLLDWTWSYVTFGRGSRLITGR